MKRFLTLSLSVLLLAQIGLLFIFKVLPFRPLPLPLVEEKKETLRFFNFNRKQDLDPWEDKTIQGKSRYWIEFEGKEGFVHGQAQESASAKYHKVRYNPQESPYLRWRWRAERFPNKTSGVGKNSDDYPARIDVVFTSHFFRNFHCLEYVWDAASKEGEVRTSPHGPQIRQIVLRNAPLGEWMEEERNVLEDYQKLFGEAPRQEIRALAIMTDADGTKSLAEGYFDNIWIGSIKQKGALS